MRKVSYYLKIFWLFTKASATTTLSQRTVMSFFIAGKIIRFVIYFGFLFFLMSGVKNFSGYNSKQVLFFFLVFNLVDLLAQLFFRSVYAFRQKVISGDLDLILIKPLNPIFTSLFGWGVDLMDLLTLPPLIILIYLVGISLNPNFINFLWFLLLLANSMLIATAFHIAVLSIALIFLEVDHTIVLYRELTTLGRFPIDIYKEPLKSIVTFVIPVGLMITLPAKALMGYATFTSVLASLFIGLVCMFASFKFWKYALKKYTSASS